MYEVNYIKFMDEKYNKVFYNVLFNYLILIFCY